MPVVEERKNPMYNVTMTKELLASMIDHTMLFQCAGIKDIVKLCSEAKKYSFASVCVNPIYVPLAYSELSGSDVKVCTVIGFPLGSTTSVDKANETLVAVANGASEVDMVINVGAALDCRFNEIELDISAVVHAASQAGQKCGRKITVKVILETCYLDDQTIQTCCQCAVRAGADFVKTSTGFAMPKGVDGQLLSNGASVHHVELMRTVVGPSFGVKASGGIRNAKNCLNMLASGANRIGTSSGVQIIDSWDESVKVPRWD